MKSEKVIKLAQNKYMKVFVIMPFTEEFNDVFQLAIKEVASQKNIKAYRLDEQLFNEGMLDKIYREIENCDFLIADLSDKNPNVFYELGYAHATGKLCILITKNAENIPFDLKHKRHIVYGNSIVYLKKQLEINVEWAGAEIENQRSTPFEIELKLSGKLEVTHEYARANINFVFDIENKTDKESPEIQAIYLYSSNIWDIYQNGRKAARKKSDFWPDNYKYQLSVETHKVPTNGWTQIDIQAFRNFANTWKDEKVVDSYTFDGHVIIEIATARGVFSHRLLVC